VSRPQNTNTCFFGHTTLERHNEETIYGVSATPGAERNCLHRTLLDVFWRIRSRG
jgi:hypothetical protein